MDSSYIPLSHYIQHCPRYVISVSLRHSMAFLFAVALVALYIARRGLAARSVKLEDLPPSISGVGIVSVHSFYRRRFDFLNKGFKSIGAIFQFNILSTTVIVLSGESARTAFLTNRHFDLTEGFKLLSGAIPMVRGITSDLEKRRIGLIHRRLTLVQTSERLSSLLPYLINDCATQMAGWTSSGHFDPFVKIYELTFQTTIRSLSCHELADDSQRVAQLKDLYDKLDIGTTPSTVLLPWLPTPAMLKKMWSTKKIYDIVVEAIRWRQASGITSDDTLQFLLDGGDDKLVVIGFIMGLLVAGSRATGTTASWLILYLAAYPEWGRRAREESFSLLSRYSSANLTQFASIPLEAWESETPVMDAIISETLRVAQPHTAMRRNLGPDAWIDNVRIPSGAYVVYPFSDVHLNPDLYPEPFAWKPERREPRNVMFGSIRWGSGKTVCLGQRLAKIELKIVISTFLVNFHHTLVDDQGASCAIPSPDWNDILLCKPTKPIFVQYQREHSTSEPI